MGQDHGIYLLRSRDVATTRNVCDAIAPAEMHPSVLLLGKCLGWST